MHEGRGRNLSTKPDFSDARRVGRAFYSAKVHEFLGHETDIIVGRLASRQVAFHSSAEAEQIRAWEAEIAILRKSLSSIVIPASWSLLLEVPLFRLGKRLDAVLLAPGFVIVIEFKIGVTQYDAAHRVQTEGYAQALRDFHEASQSRTVVPILCVENAPSRNVRLHVVDKVGDLILRQCGYPPRCDRSYRERHRQPR